MATPNLIVNDKAHKKETKFFSVILFGLMIFFSFLENDSFFQMETFIAPAMMVIIFACFEMLILNKARITVTRIHIFLLLYLMISIAALFIEIYRNSINFVLFYFITTVFFLALTYRTWSVKELKYVVNCYYLTGLITAILIITTGKLTSVGRYSINLRGGELLEVNYLAALLCTPAIIAFKRSLLNKSKFGMLVNILAFITIIFGMFLTGSRAAFLATMIGTFTVFLVPSNASGKRKQPLKILILFILFCITIGLVTFVATNYLPTGIFERFFVNSYDDGSNSSRLTYWQNLLEMLSDSPIWGFGHNSFYYKNLQYYGTTGAAHNTYLSVMFSTGIVGFSFFMGFLYYAVKDCFKKQNRLLLSIVFNVFITTSIIGAILSLYLWINIIIVYQCCRVIAKNEKISVNDIM